MQEAVSQTQSATASTTNDENATDNVTELEPESPSAPSADVDAESSNANGAGAPTANNNNKDKDDDDSNNAKNGNVSAATKDDESLQLSTAGNSKGNPSKPSSLKSDSNPLTISRQKAASEGRPLIVNFDERVVVHTVPYWDPCGETFNDADDDDGPRGPNCCAIL